MIKRDGHPHYGARSSAQEAYGERAAIGAAAVVRALAEGEVERPGIWLAEQAVPPGPFFERLAAGGLVPRVEVPLSLFQAEG